MQKQRKNWSYEELWNIAAAYGKAWAEQKPLLSKLGAVYQESKLPYPKEKIKHALATLLLIEDDTNEISLLGEGYTRLDSFVSDDVYKFVRSKISVPNTTIVEMKNPTEEVLDRLHRMFKLSQEDEELQLRIMSDMMKERAILYKELSILLGIIGDPNNLVETLEQIIER